MELIILVVVLLSLGLQFGTLSVLKDIAATLRFLLLGASKDD